MRASVSFLLISSAVVWAIAQPAGAQPACTGVNTLSAAEKAAGWVLLFDGSTTNGWHGYNGQAIGSWKVADCALQTVGEAGNSGSDLLPGLTSNREFTNFELSIDWRASKGGNSGVLYGVVEDPKYKAVWETGPEYQLLDDVGFPQKLEEWQKAGADYAMHVPNDQKQLKPVGEWNTTKLVVNGAHVEHWLNGKKILAFERWTDDWKKLRDACQTPELPCKWRDYPGWGMAATGRLVLQDHGSVFAFRNVKLRRLP
jgi:hypothetical protein